MWLFRRKGSPGFSSSSTAEKVTQGIDGTGLTAVVTVDREAKDAILREIPTAKVDVKELYLSSLASVRKFASDFKGQDLLLNILMNCGNSIQAFRRQHRTPLCNELPGKMAVGTPAKFTSPRSNCHQRFSSFGFINATACYVALLQVEGKGGLYFSDSSIAQLKSQAVNTAFAQNL